MALLIPAFGGDPMGAPRLMRNAVEARAAGVKLIAWNSSGPMIEERTGFPMYDLRLDMVEALRQGGVPSIIIQPTVYLENLLGPWTQPNIVERNGLTYPVADDARLGWIASADVAAFVVAALAQPQLAGQKIVVSGMRNLSGPELAQEVSAGLGREISYRAMPLEEFGAALDKAFGPGAGQGGVAGYKFQEENRDRIATWVEMAPVLEKLPVQMTSVSQWAAQFAPAFSPVEVQQ
ncbi:MAG: NmrA family NAD(P)-binding protein [Anaerolineales bacterium]|nr:NmrA family NAD(P)-binding protein [Anaerolineales bacterium]